MSESTKAILRRLLHEIIVGGNLELTEELVAPDFINHRALEPG